MDYKIIVVKAVGLFGTNFEAAAEKLAEDVGREIKAGWEPQGGVCSGTSLSFKRPYLFQAMVRRR
jgi:hypothetical protein